MYFRKNNKNEYFETLILFYASKIKQAMQIDSVEKEMKKVMSEISSYENRFTNQYAQNDNCC